MKRFRKLLIVLGILAVLLGTTAWFGLGLVLNASPIRKQIEASLSDSLGMPLTIEAISYSPASGLQLRGVVVPNKPQDFLRADRTLVRARLLGLMERKLIVDEIVIEAPRIDWSQNEEGRFELPQLAKVEKAEGAEPVEKAPAKKPDEKEQEFVVEARRLMLERGAAILRDRDGNKILELATVRIEAAPGTIPGNFAGVAEAASAIIGLGGGPLLLEDIRIPFTSTSDGLDLSGFTARLAGGDLSARAFAALQEETQPARLDLKLAGVDVHTLLAMFGEDETSLTGKLDGRLECAGELASLDEYRGGFSLDLRDGVLNQHPALQTAGLLLGMEELIRLPLKEAFLRVEFQDEKARITGLTFASESIRMDAKGSVEDGGELRLKAALAVRGSMLASMPSEIRSNFVQDASLPGWASIPFDIKGTLLKPETNLKEKILDGSVENLLMNVLGFGNDEKDEQPETKE